jgi:hypothetical protein
MMSIQQNRFYSDKAWGRAIVYQGGGGNAQDNLAHIDDQTSVRMDMSQFGRKTLRNSVDKFLIGLG